MLATGGFPTKAADLQWMEDDGWGVLDRILQYLGVVWIRLMRWGGRRVMWNDRMSCVNAACLPVL